MSRRAERRRAARGNPYASLEEEPESYPGRTILQLIGLGPAPKKPVVIDLVQGVEAWKAKRRRADG